MIPKTSTVWTTMRGKARVEDLTGILNYASEDIDGMDDDAGEEQAQNPSFTKRWTATSSYDVLLPLEHYVHFPLKSKG